MTIDSIGADSVVALVADSVTAVATGRSGGGSSMNPIVMALVMIGGFKVLLWVGTIIDRLDKYKKMMAEKEKAEREAAKIAVGRVVVVSRKEG